MSALMQWSYGGMSFHYWDLAHKKIGYKNQLSSQHLAATLVFSFYLKKKILVEVMSLKKNIFKIVSGKFSCLQK